MPRLLFCIRELEWQELRVVVDAWRVFGLSILLQLIALFYFFLARTNGHPDKVSSSYAIFG